MELVPWEETKFGALRLPDSVFEAVHPSHYLNIPKDWPQVIYEYASTPFLQPAPNVSILAAFAAVVQPETAGYITINFSDYRDDPLIYSNYYGSDGDKAATIMDTNSCGKSCTLRR